MIINVRKICLSKVCYAILSFGIAFFIIAGMTACSGGTNSSVSTGSSSSSSQSSSGNNSSKSTDNFQIEGKWKSVGDWGVGQAQPGSIVTFDGKNCNLVSPNDTYAFYKQGSGYILDATTALFSQNSSFNVKITDNDNIELTAGGNTTKLKRVG